MYFIGGILSFFVFLFVSSIDIKLLNKKEIIKVSISYLKRYYNILNFIIIFLVNLYFIYLFLNNDILYMINLLCFLCIYICALTDIFCKNIFLNIIMMFSLAILLLNIYGNYSIISFFGLISGMILFGSIYSISKIIYGMEVFGTGDIYVLSFIGFSSDWYTVIYIGLFTFIIAGIFYLVKILIVRNFKKLKHYEIPLVPFILISYLIIIYF